MSEDLAGQTPEQFLAAVKEVVEVSTSPLPAPTQKWTFSMYLQGRWYGLYLDTDTIDKDDPIKSLDVSLLQDRILAPLLNMEEPAYR